VEEAAVLVCDERSTPPVSVWHGRRGQLTNLEWPWKGQGFAALYSQCAELLGFGPDQCHRLEALARVAVNTDWTELSSCFRYIDDSLRVSSDWVVQVERELCGFHPMRNAAPGARVASAFQRAMGDQLLSLVQEIHSVLPVASLCLGGGLFYNTYFNTLLSESALFKNTFVAPNPGNAGIAVGAALAVARDGSTKGGETVSPFLGPEYDLEAIKSTLDNCKLSYDCLSEREVTDAVVNALVKGRLVGWFQGRMEWAHRALGNRSILASPLSPYVLDNLNVYLKQRERYRAYGVSVCEDDVERYFCGPPRSRWMEYEYVVRDQNLFQYVMPRPARRVRVQTVERESHLFYDLHKAFAEATGTGVLVNTSFNGLSEPIVCSPRDAIRAFFGTGLDMLVLGGRFIVRK
jgi:carbamoyltransferase